MVTPWAGVACNGAGSVASLSLVCNWQQLGGAIDPAIGQLTALQTLDLTYCWVQGTLPTQIGLLTALTSLTLQYSSISGMLPSEVGLLTALTSLTLQYSLISGTLPSEMGQLTAIQVVDLSANLISGSIPDVFAGLSSLTRLSLWQNSLSGTLPPSLGSLPSLGELDVYNNPGLSGFVLPNVNMPYWWSGTQLEITKASDVAALQALKAQWCACDCFLSPTHSLTCEPSYEFRTDTQFMPNACDSCSSRPPAAAI